MTVWSILLLKDSQTTTCGFVYEKPAAALSMDDFHNYGKKQKNIIGESRSLGKTAMSYNDSSIHAFNSQPGSPEMVLTDGGSKPMQSLTNLKFEMEDAKEPDEITKEIIRVHRAKHLLMKKNARKRTSLPVSKRMIRSAQLTTPQLIKFEVSDAMEPDEDTKELIRQNRVRMLDLTTEYIGITPTGSSHINVRQIPRQRKRSRRSTQKTQPELIRFELRDVNEPSFSIMDTTQQNTKDDNRSDTVNRLLNQQSNGTANFGDSFVQESKRYLYEVVPITPTSVVSLVPTEVQNIIDRIPNYRKPQANYKCIASSQYANFKCLTNSVGNVISIPLTSTAQHFVSVYSSPHYVQKNVPTHTFPINPFSAPPPQENTRLTAFQPEVPKMTKIQHYYRSVAPFKQPERYLEIGPAAIQIIHEIPTRTVVQHSLSTSLNTINSDISARYPHTTSISVDPCYRYENTLEFHPSRERQHDISNNDHSAIGDHNEKLSIKPQQHIASKKNVDQEKQKTQLMNMQEFGEWSVFISKSSIDLHQSSQQSGNPTQLEERKVRNAQPKVLPQLIENLQPKDQNTIQAYNSPVSHISPIKTEPTAVFSTSSSLPLPTYNNAVKNLGLSSNVKWIDQFKKLNPALSGGEISHKTQYAPKYAFGYSVRDLNSGNDFGHKQHRDCGVTHGHYHVLLPDGRMQNVIYHADDSGFHADVNFEAERNH